MRQAIAVLLLALATCTILAAPAPSPRRLSKYKEPEFPTPGIYMIAWGGSREQLAEVFPNKTCWFMYNDTKYWMMFEYNTDTRLLRTWERQENWGGHDFVQHGRKSEMSNFNFRFLPHETVAKANQENHCNLSIRRVR